MSAILVFMAGIAGIIGWWMARQRLASKPWLEVGLAGDAQQMQGSSATIAKVGLGIFLAVVGALGLAAALSGAVERIPLLFWLAAAYVALLPLEVKLAIT